MKTAKAVRNIWDIGWEIATLAGLLLREVVMQPAPEELTQEQIIARRTAADLAQHRCLTEDQAEDLLRRDVEAHNRVRDRMRQREIAFGGTVLPALHARPGIADATYEAIREAHR